MKRGRCEKEDEEEEEEQYQPLSLRCLATESALRHFTKEELRHLSYSIKSEIMARRVEKKRESIGGRLTEHFKFEFNWFGRLTTLVFKDTDGKINKLKHIESSGALLLTCGREKSRHDYCYKTRFKISFNMIKKLVQNTIPEEVISLAVKQWMT